MGAQSEKLTFEFNNVLNNASNSASEQPILKPNTKLLSRNVFDKLFEEDYLGFMLSSYRFEKYLKRMQMSKSTDVFSMRLLNIVLHSDDEFNSFHIQTLSMFVGSYIDECRIKSHDDLMLALDAKWKQLTDESISSSRDLNAELNKVEAAWQYRH